MKRIPLPLIAAVIAGVALWLSRASFDVAGTTAAPVRVAMLPSLPELAGLLTLTLIVAAGMASVLRSRQTFWEPATDATAAALRALAAHPSLPAVARRLAPGTPAARWPGPNHRLDCRHWSGAVDLSSSTCVAHRSSIASHQPFERRGSLRRGVRRPERAVRAQRPGGSEHFRRPVPYRRAVAASDVVHSAGRCPRNVVRSGIRHRGVRAGAVARIRRARGNASRPVASMARGRAQRRRSRSHLAARDRRSVVEQVDDAGPACLSPAACSWCAHRMVVRAPRAGLAWTRGCAGATACQRRHHADNRDAVSERPGSAGW